VVRGSLSKQIFSRPHLAIGVEEKKRKESAPDLFLEAQFSRGLPDASRLIERAR